MRNLFVAAGALAALSLAGAAHAEIIHYMAMLDGASEVPAHAVPGKGMATAQLDTATKTLTYKVDFSGLTGPATMAHFHGPALAGANAPPVVVIATPVTSGVTGSKVLTDAEIADLNAGKWYVNVHTDANKPGEIRGQVMTTKK
ncbi:MAG: hypothetical protein JWO72_2634 [Caulobacteraceae bacterium]|nr:hypothetical protein [Caulobacteraceae bacterium]